MDTVTFAVALACGGLLGLLTGLVPSLHVNTVCVVVLAMASVAGPTVAIGLTAMAVVHAFGSLLPSTYLGAPGEETLLSALPAHRMLLEGRGPDAVKAGLDGSLAGILLGLGLALPYKWLLAEPGRLLGLVAEGAGWILLAIAVLLVARERRRGAGAVLWATVVLVVSGALGLLSTRLAVQAFVAVPASPLLPLLSGLFGAPALVETLRSQPVVPRQSEAVHVPALVRRSMARACVAGSLAAGVTAVLPGVSSSISAALARAGRPEHDGRTILAMLGAIATSHLVLTFVVLWLSGHARTGLAVAVAGAWGIDLWVAGVPPLPLRWVLLTCVCAAVLGYALTAVVARPAARWFPRLRPRPVAGVALAAVVGLVALFSGLPGLVLFLVAALVGLVPLSAGLGRVHLTGCLLVPVVAYRFGWA